MEERCIADECRKTAEPGRKYCHGHRKREKRRQTLDTPLREWGLEPDKYLAAKADAYADADPSDESSYRRAFKNLKRAAVWYAKKATRPKVPKPTKTP